MNIEHRTRNDEVNFECSIVRMIGVLRSIPVTSYQLLVTISSTPSSSYQQNHRLSSDRYICQN
jgi:hypothetical protein